MNENSSTGDNSANTDLLMLSLPHHAQSLRPDSMLSSTQFDLVYQCIKGSMYPVVGDTWSYDVRLPQIGFDDVDMNAYTQDLKSHVRDLILDNVKQDLDIILPTLSENVYGFGKQVARLAQLSHIASVMDFSAWVRANRRTNTTSGKGPKASSTFDHAIEQLQSFLVAFLDGQVSDQLVYDAKFGGIVTTDGLYDKNADFGNGR